MQALVDRFVGFVLKLARLLVNVHVGVLIPLYNNRHGKQDSHVANIYNLKDLIDSHCTINGQYIQ